MKKLIIILLVLMKQIASLILPSHQPLCLLYHYENSQYYKDNSCINIPNCAISYDGVTNRCLLCQPEYAPNKSYECIPLKQINCLTYDSVATKCIQCESGYFLSLGYCTKTDNCLQTIQPTEFFAFNGVLQLLENDLEIGELNTQCRKCVDGYVQNYDFQCVKPEVSTCAELGADGKCKKCIPLFSQDSSGVCVQNNCLKNKPKQYLVCEQCEPGYNDQQNQVCLKIPTNCQIPHPLKGICVVCKDGYELNEQFECIPKNCNVYDSTGLCSECKKGYRYSPTSQYCECFICTLNKDIENICTGCQLNDKFVKINKGDDLYGVLPYNVNIGCVREGCRKSDQQLNCIECFEQYNLVSGNCVEKINGCLRYDISTQTCLACKSGDLCQLAPNAPTTFQCSIEQYEQISGVCGDIPFCSIASQVFKGQCIKCNSDYILDSQNQCFKPQLISSCAISENDICIQQNEVAIMYQTNQSKSCKADLKVGCIFCDSTAVFDQVSFSCQQVLHCIQYDPSNLCLKCANGYQLLNNACTLICETCINSKYCAKNINDDPSQKCQTCQIGHFLDVKSGMCMRIPFCLFYSTNPTTGETQCIECTFSFTLIQGQCVFCMQGICGLHGLLDNCLVHLKHGTQFTCMLCKPGYFIDNNYKCGTIRNCQLFDEKNVNKCIQAKVGYYLDEAGLAGLLDNCKNHDVSRKLKVCLDCKTCSFLEQGVCYKNIDGCDVYKSNLVECAKCLPNYQIIIPNQLSICEKQIVIEFCLQVNQELTNNIATCIQCKDQYQLNKDCTSCIAISESCSSNCLTCRKSECIECQYGYLPDGGDCKSAQLQYNSTISQSQVESISTGGQTTSILSQGSSIGISVVETAVGTSIGMNISMMTSQKIALLFLININLPPVIQKLMEKISEQHPSEKFQGLNLLRLEQWEVLGQAGKKFKNEKFQQRKFYYNILMTSGSAFTLFAICMIVKMMFSYLSRMQEKALKVYEVAVAGQIFTYLWIAIQIFAVGFLIQFDEFITEPHLRDVKFKIVAFIVFTGITIFITVTIYRILESQLSYYSNDSLATQSKTTHLIEYNFLTSELIYQSKYRRCYLFYYFLIEFIGIPAIIIFCGGNSIACSFILFVVQIFQLMVTVYLRPFVEVLGNIHFIIDQLLWVTMFLIWLILSFISTIQKDDLDGSATALDGLSWAFVVVYYLITLVNPIFTILKVGNKILQIIKQRNKTKMDERLIINHSKNFSSNNLDDIANQVNIEFEKKNNNYTNSQDDEKNLSNGNTCNYSQIMVNQIFKKQQKTENENSIQNSV